MRELLGIVIGGVASFIGICLMIAVYLSVIGLLVLGFKEALSWIA